ncbi:S-layer homology domain-containing protein [Peptoniphilus sp. BV3AC2]|uniref:S-layer homology domain-containing protein n=1 Tax=Peptoniphilus sp. BV3AC2 TaxID=1111133 RepID=UPI0003B8D799|nr:S-layer homology domain-containing protein [Peptoniphilus sp. BV3AC2]ERT64630.1 SLH domain protein [Peptoniphilus sp. BV3AC2]
MRFTTYVVKEDTESANPYTPKDKEQGKKVKVTLYDVLAGGDKGQEVSFTNVFDPDKKIDFTAEKKWEVPTGLTLKDADYPTMNFTLYRKVKGGTEAEVKDNGVKPAEITKEKRTAGWKNLDAFDASGNEYTYSVEETFKDTTDAKNANWITGKMVTEEGKNTITNKLKEVAKPGENPDPEKNPVGKLTIKKVLKNEAEATQMKALRAASEPIKFSFEVTGPYNYKETFKLAAGEEKELKNLYYGEYTVKETETETHGFEPSYNPKNGKATLKAGEAEKTIIVTNTNKGGTTTDPTNVTITVNKVWVGGTKPATEIELWRKGQDAKGTAIDEKVNKFTTTEGQDSSQEFKTKEDGTPLAKYDPSGREFEYYAKELNVPANYKATYSQDKLTVTNTYNAPKDGEFTATKVWDMTGAGKDYPSPEKTDVWFKLYRNIAGQAPVAVEGADLKKIAKDATDLTAKWEGLDKTDKDGKTYVYRVKEVDKDGNDFTPENFKKTEETNKVTNTILPKAERTGKLTIKKNFVNTRPAAASLSLMSKVAPKALTFKATVTGPYGYSKEVELSTTKDVVLENLYFGEYTVTEKAGDEYEATYNPAGGKVTLTAKDKEATVTVTNTVKAENENRDITLTKTWENGPARTAEDITVTLKRNNEVQTATATVTKTNDHEFVYTFKGQAVYDGNGKPYEYTVEEKVKDELKDLYTAGKIEGTAEEGFTVTNTYKVPKDGSFTATKVWAGDEKVTRPTMNFELWRKVGETDEKVPETAVKIVDGTNMTATWEKLEKTNQAGQEYTFYVKETFKEDSVENQNWKLGEFDDKSKSITNTVKTPNDGLGKLTIKKELLKTGEGVMVLRSAAEPLKFSFKVTGPYGYEKTFDLAPGATEELTDLYFGKYKVEETDSKGYTPTYNPEQEVTLTTTDNDITVTVTNTSKTDTNSVTEVTATKEWVNGPEEDHIAVDLTLKRISAKEGSEEETVNATATITGTAPTFTYKWSNLAKHDANGYEYTYFVEEPNLPENYEATYSQDKLTVTNTYKAPQTEEYLAIFNGNGGKPVTQKKIAKDGEVIAGVIIPTKEGYKFVKWVKLGTNVEFDPTKPFSKDILDPGDNSVMFTAVWEKGETSEPNPEPQPEPQPTPYYNPWWPIWFGSSETKKEEPKPLERHDAYISGYPDGTVRPDGKITRAEVSAIFARLTESSAPANYSPKFSDVLAYDWFCDSVMKLSKKDIIKGYPEGTFKPNKSITRAEFAVIASKYIKNPKAADETFSDVPMNHWAKDAIAKVKAEGLISGYPDGTFKPDAPITRAEAVSIVNRMFDRVADGEFVRNHKFEIKSFKDLVENHWAYYKIYEATNGHDFVRDSNKIDEEWKYVTNKSFVYDK